MVRRRLPQKPQRSFHLEKLESSHRPHSLPKSQSPSHPPLTLDPPPEGVFKLNFDGASKGNPGPAGFGGIIRNVKGEAQIIYYGSIGWDSNNFAELEGLWQGLCLIQHHKFLPIIIEGDSQILINIAKKLLWGTTPEKVAHSW